MTWSGELWFPRCYLSSRKYCCKITQDKSHPRHSASPQAKSLRLRGKNDHTKEKQAGMAHFQLNSSRFSKVIEKEACLKLSFSRKIPMSKETIPMWFWPCVQCTPTELACVPNLKVCLMNYTSKGTTEGFAAISNKHLGSPVLLCGIRPSKLAMC